MTKLHVTEAKERLEEVLDKGAKGEAIEITGGDGTTYEVRIRMLETAAPTKRRSGLGQGKTVLYMSDDFDDEDPEINKMWYGAT